MKYSKICVVCNSAFKSSHKTAKYCSKKCGQKLNLELIHKKNEKAMRTGEYEGNERYLKLRFMILKRDNFTCQYCGRTPQDGVKLNIDHIIPKSKGGKLSFDNLITSCYECNQGKKDILLEERQIKKLQENIINEFRR